ncbi:MAG TPA: tetratricopeptide repeat protein [Marinospirillum sp.]|uniref:tetratricopeptide repeat protein n=1 Tax=Marinospirillum sp. TaxID=2183934 RepID=UPI002B4A6262|nr:tetratricopeptide repeat protein [Marinospirillum sp.]HKM16043.1 tetratricopeptide repeat protein [Marinospirillum sp.]
MQDMNSATQQHINEAKANTETNPRCGESWKTLGLALKEIGDNTEALKALRKASMLLPKDLDIFKDLADILLLEKNYSQAIGYLKYLTSQEPENSIYWNNLGLVYLEDKQPKLAVECFQEAIKHDINFFDAYSNLAKTYKKEKLTKEFRNTLVKMQKLPPKDEQEWAELAHQWIDSDFTKEGLLAFNQLIELNQNNKFIPYLKGIFAFKNGHMKKALALFQQAIKLTPNEPKLVIALTVIISKNDPEAAIEILKKAEQRIPNNVEILRQLCILLYNNKKNKEIIGYLEKLIVLDPDAAAFKMIGHYKNLIGDHDKAIQAFEESMSMQAEKNYQTDNSLITNYSISLMFNEQPTKAIKIIKKELIKQPNNTDFIGLLSQALYRIGEIDESIKISKKTINKKPYNPSNISNYFFASIHSNKLNIEELFKEHKKFSSFFEKPIKPFSEYTNKPEPDRKLKIGFVSGDMCAHAVAYFAMYVFEILDNNQFELSVFNTFAREDSTTQKLKNAVNQWFDVAEMGNYELAEFIKNQEIDILVDLSGHTGHNRLPTFAYKPAPIQITAIGYPYTTGLNAMDYVFMSSLVNKIEEFQKYWTEKFIIFPQKALNLRPQRRKEASKVTEQLPAYTNGYFTYASLNRFSKINEASLNTWVIILQKNPTSKMLLGNVEKDKEQEIIDFFVKNKIPADRLILKPRLTLIGYMALFNQIDLMLDTWPYGGGTTTSDALSMGVPVLSLKGNHPVQVLTHTIHYSLNLDNFLADNVTDYISAAVAWAEQLEELQTIRLDLINRPELIANEDENPSYLNWNKGLRMAWQRWCAGLPVESFRIPD